MRKAVIKLEIFLVAICLVFVLPGCQATGTTASLTPTLALTWQIEVSKFEIKDNLIGLSLET
jgi:uncharacterized lipoprotein YajG